MNSGPFLTATPIVAILVAACSATEITETPWIASPDGQWLTRVVRYDTAGPGIGALYETVQLKHRSTGKEAKIFTIDEGELTRAQLSGSPVIALHWRDLHHLEIDYRAGKVVHQAGQIADLNVTAREYPTPRQPNGS